MSSADGIAYIVTGDASLRECLRGSLATHTLPAVTFGSAAEYLGFARPDVPACLILDLHLPDMNGLHLQRIAAKHAPIVFVVGGQADVASSVCALKAGAVDFLTAPVGSEELFRAVELAIELDRRSAPERIRLAQLSARHGRLTPRECQVLGLIVNGCLNKQAALNLGISETTVQIHRGRVMRKMEARSFADLVRMADTLKLLSPRVCRTSRYDGAWSAAFHIGAPLGLAAVGVSARA